MILSPTLLPVTIVSLAAGEMSKWVFFSSSPVIHTRSPSESHPQERRLPSEPACRISVYNYPGFYGTLPYRKNLLVFGSKLHPQAKKNNDYAKGSWRPLAKMKGIGEPIWRTLKTSRRNSSLWDTGVFSVFQCMVSFYMPVGLHHSSDEIILK